MRALDSLKLLGCFYKTNKVFHRLGPIYRPKPEQPHPRHLENPERVFHS